MQAYLENDKIISEKRKVFDVSEGMNEGIWTNGKIMS